MPGRRNGIPEAAPVRITIFLSGCAEKSIPDAFLPNRSSLDRWRPASAKKPRESINSWRLLRSKLSRMTAIRVVARATLVAISAVIVVAQEPEAFVIDPGQTTITLHVGRAGVFAFAGHDHEVVVPAVRDRSR